MYDLELVITDRSDRSNRLYDHITSMKEEDYDVHRHLACNGVTADSFSMKCYWSQTEGDKWSSQPSTKSAAAAAAASMSAEQVPKYRVSTLKRRCPEPQSHVVDNEQQPQQQLEPGEEREADWTTQALSHFDLVHSIPTWKLDKKFNTEKWSSLEFKPHKPWTAANSADLQRLLNTSGRGTKDIPVARLENAISLADMFSTSVSGTCQGSFWQGDSFLGTGSTEVTIQLVSTPWDLFKGTEAASTSAPHNDEFNDLCWEMETARGTVSFNSLLSLMSRKTPEDQERWDTIGKLL